jgi:hypothetical protein
MALFKRRDGASVQRSIGGGSWLAYPTLTHGDAGMLKLAGPHHHRSDVANAIRHHGSLVLAELKIEQDGRWAGAVRVFVGAYQVASVPADMQNEYRTVVELLAGQRLPATIHAELELGEYVDVWGLCKPLPRREGEPLLPTQYRQDLQLFDGVAAHLDDSLHSRAKEKKVRRDVTLSLGPGGGWTVFDSESAVGTLPLKPYRRLHEVMAAGLRPDAVLTVHRRPERPLAVHVSIPPDR